VGAAVNAVERSRTPCAICGTIGFSTSYSKCAEKTRMDRDGLCFGCAFWELRAEKGCPTVIDGCTYTPGTRTSGEFRGCGGRRFDIEYFDGRRVTTFDLWVGGVIPERWRNRIPDTARFLNGAERVQVGDTICFQESRP
jgi:hypothetical protein